MANGGSLVHAGEYTAQIAGGGTGSISLCLPSMACKNLDIEVGDGVDTYIDFENGVVMQSVGSLGERDSL